MLCIIESRVKNNEDAIDTIATELALERPEDERNH